MHQLWVELRNAIRQLNYLRDLVYEQQRQIVYLEQQLRDVRGL